MTPLTHARGLVLAALPLFAAALAAAVVVTALAYTIYTRKQLVDERTMRYQAFVHGKRAQQDILRRDLALAKTTLALVDDRRDRQLTSRIHAPGSVGFGAALRYRRARIAAAAAEQRPSPPRPVTVSHQRH